MNFEKSENLKLKQNTDSATGNLVEIKSLPPQTISWNIVLRKECPILMFLRIKLSTCLKKYLVKSVNFEISSMTSLWRHSSKTKTALNHL